ncbi:hypothetical protein AVEN_85479-1 [Araneus ventricosus]|uniref:Uncharacterized protein n=1 Tax=Araneus ventricosus TaxID=182803 RepID=A0A4Y2FC40_ARAVE|nr:hypothetical protein AVEN_85479-1 [Araneus ventricosus]
MALPPENPTQPTGDRFTVAPISHFSIHHQHQKNLSAEIPENTITSQLHTRKLKDSVPAFCQIELFPLKNPSLSQHHLSSPDTQAISLEFDEA